MQGRHKSVFSSKALPFQSKLYDLPPNLLSHTALVAPPQVPKGLHNFAPRHVEELQAMESNGPIPEPRLPGFLSATSSKQPLLPLSLSFLICEMGT